MSYRMESFQKEKMGEIDTVPRRISWVRRGFLILAWIFVLCILIQVFIAGMAIFVNPANWALHESFVHYFELIPLLLLVLAFAGRMPRELRWIPVAMFVLMIIQYATINIAHSTTYRIVGAIHPVNALFLFWGAVTCAQRARRSVSQTGSTLQGGDNT